MWYTRFVNVAEWQLRLPDGEGNPIGLEHAYVYAIILSFSEDKKGAFFGSAGYLAERMCVSVSTARRVLKNLLAWGHIRKCNENRLANQTNSYIAVLPSENQGSQNDKGIKMIASQNDHLASQNDHHSIKDINKELNHPSIRTASNVVEGESVMLSEQICEGGLLFVKVEHPAAAAWVKDGGSIYGH